MVVGVAAARQPQAPAQQVQLQRPQPGQGQRGAGSEFEVEIRRAISRAALRHRDQLARYAFGSGQEALRRAIARHALAMGCRLDPARIVVANGCRDALVLGLRAVTRPGDVVALESPTYFGLLEILRHLGLRALEIPTHPRHGLSLDALQFALGPVNAMGGLAPPPGCPQG